MNILKMHKRLIEQKRFDKFLSYWINAGYSYMLSEPWGFTISYKDNILEAITEEDMHMICIKLLDYDEGKNFDSIQDDISSITKKNIIVSNKDTDEVILIL